jgi:hypothetical protein
LIRGSFDEMLVLRSRSASLVIATAARQAATMRLIVIALPHGIDFPHLLRQLRRGNSPSLQALGPGS